MTKYQQGSVVPSGKRVKVWVGRYRLYRPDGSFVNRKVVLGQRQEMTLSQARTKLLGIVTSDQPVALDERMTVKTFVEQRWLPLFRWRQAMADSQQRMMNAYVLPALGTRRIGEVTEFELRTWLNRLSETYSRSVVLRCRWTVRSIFRAAVRQEFILKDPAAYLPMPETRSSDDLVFSNRQLRRLIKALPSERDRLVLSIASFSALRPSELFALRWQDYDGQCLRLQSTVYRSTLQERRMKTAQAKAPVPLPLPLHRQLQTWRRQVAHAPGDLMFPNSGGRPLDGRNFLQRVVQPVAEKLGLPTVTFQRLRRSAATNGQAHGSMKDLQALLRHASIQTTGDIYVKRVEDSVQFMVDALWRDVMQPVSKVVAKQKRLHAGSRLKTGADDRT